MCGLYNLCIRHAPTNCGYFWQPYCGWWGPDRRTSSRSYGRVSIPTVPFPSNFRTPPKIPTYSCVVYLLVRSSSFSFPPHSSLPIFTYLCTTLRRWNGTDSNECAKGRGYYWGRCSRRVWEDHAAIGETIPMENITRLVHLFPSCCTFQAVADVLIVT